MEKLWASDPSVWGNAAPAAGEWLGWLGLPGTMGGCLGEMTRMAEEAASEGIADVVLLGMGGSSLAPEMFFSVFGSAPGRPRLTVLDSTHPEAVASVRTRIDPARTLFLVSLQVGDHCGDLVVLPVFLGAVLRGGRPVRSCHRPGHSPGPPGSRARFSGGVQRSRRCGRAVLGVQRLRAGPRRSHRGESPRSLGEGPGDGGSGDATGQRRTREWAWGWCWERPRRPGWTS